MSTIRGDVLVLNKSWFPIHIVSPREAFRQLCNGAANGFDHRTSLVHDLESWRQIEVDEMSMEIGEDYVRHGHRIPILIPRILILVKYDRLPSGVVKYNRNGVYERDNYTCQYCATKFQRGSLKDKNQKWLINIDHIVPRCHPEFPGTNFLNCVTSCVKCNGEKGGRTPKEAGMRLLKKPTIPKWKPRVYGATHMHPAWIPFLPGEKKIDVDTAIENSTREEA